MYVNDAHKYRFLDMMSKCEVTTTSDPDHQLSTALYILSAFPAMAHTAKWQLSPTRGVDFDGLFNQNLGQDDMTLARLACNLFLGEVALEAIEIVKIQDEERYRVARAALTVRRYGIVTSADF
jgi:hypothetical protein